MFATCAAAVDQPGALQHAKMPGNGRAEMRNGLARALAGLSSLTESRTRMRRRVGSARAAKIAVIRLLLLTNLLIVI